MLYTVAALSDLHLGVVGHPADDFGGQGRLRMLCEMLHQMREGVDQVVMVGDMLELWQFSLAEILGSRGWMLEELADLVDIIVRGNHDRALPDRFLGTPVADEWRIGDCVFVHGSRFDRWNSGLLGWVGRSVAWLGGLGELTVSRHIDDWFTGAQRVAGNGRYSADTRYARAARRWARRQDTPTSAVVIGHTHRLRPLPATRGPVRTWNTGTWTGGETDILTIAHSKHGWTAGRWPGQRAVHT